MKSLKKLLAILLILVMTISLFSCAANSNQDPAQLETPSVGVESTNGATFGDTSEDTALSTFSIIEENPAIPSSMFSYEELFSRAMTSDAAISEGIAAELVEVFDNDAMGLVAAMSKCTSEEVERVAQLLVYGKSYFDLNKFETELEELKTNMRSNEETDVLDLILTTIYHFNDISLLNLSDVPPPAIEPFDVDTILNFIEINEATRNIDEEFFHTIGNAYRLDPELFANTISDRSSDSIAYIAKAIAYDCIHTSDGLGAVTKVTTDKQSNNYILDIIEAAIADKANGSLEVFYNDSKVE